MSARIVSIVVPCRNERAGIDAFCAGALAQSLPDGWALELLVADGGSDDGTREQVQAWSRADARCIGFDNPGRIVSTGLNAALARARGEVVVRMDVHTDYAPDYVAQCVAVLAETGADNVGGPWRARTAAPGEPAPAPMQQAIAAAFQSRWVAGGALSRRLDHEGRVDTVYLGCWPRATFERFGTFDESLVRNQDDEHNLRIVDGGGRVWQSPRIRSAYRTRARLGAAFRQYLQYGYWKPFVMRKHRRAASPRHLAPAVFLLLLAGAALAGALGAGPWAARTAGLLAALYGAGVLGASVAIAIRARLGAAAALRVPAVIGACHLAYALGSLAGWRDVLRSARAQARYTSLTR